MQISDGEFHAAAAGSSAVTALSHLTHEREKTRRLLIGAACIFLVVAAVVVLWVPAEKQKLAYLIGAALFIMAMGAIGAARFSIRIPGVHIQSNGASAFAEPTSTAIHAEQMASLNEK